jgi:thiamine kinase-like enzyme
MQVDPNKNSEVLDETFTQAISAAIQQELKLSSPPELAFKIIYDDDRRIYKIKVKQRSEFFVLKIRGIKVVKQADLDLDDLQKEYDFLETAWQSAGSMKDGLGMSKPIHLWLDKKAMLLSGCRGSNLNDQFNQHVFKWAFSPQYFSNALLQCGRWLGNYHNNAATVQPLSGAFDNRVKNLQRMLTALRAKKPSFLSCDDFTSIESKFNQLVSNTTQGPVCQVHGNFAYRNVLALSTETNLVDFEDAHIEHVAFDIGQFTAELLFKSQFPWLRHRTKGFFNAFVSGYKQENELQSSICQAYLGYHLVVHFYEHTMRKAPNGIKGFILNYRKRYLAKLIKQWLKQETLFG